MGFLRNVVAAFRPSNIRQGLDVARTPIGVAGAEAAATGTRAVAAQRRVLRGPAGEHRHGAGPADAEREERDPAAQARIRSAERAARAAARAPYRAPDARPVTITRIATRGGTQLDEVIAHLGSSGLGAHPERVYGTYRVPDRISASRTPHSEQGRVVEWDIVHLPDPPGATPDPVVAPVAATSFRADDHWVDRRVGQPSPLDEDLAVAFCRWAGIGPEHSLGLARMSEVRTLRRDGGEDGVGPLRPLVRGIVALHPPDPSGTFAALAAAAPIELPDPATFGIHVEVLDWGAVARAVHPRIHHPPACPSPFPHLPSTPQELLLSYLEVVGIDPADSYGVQATFDHPAALGSGSRLTRDLGPRQACVDGKERTRTHACEHVVIVHRDRPEYAAGRTRWRAYQEEVLRARLHEGTGARPVVTAGDLSDIDAALLRSSLRAPTTVDWSATHDLGAVPPHRYCWPPLRTAEPLW